jgi:hypothetical protein
MKYAFWCPLPDLGPDKGFWVSHNGRILSSTDKGRMERFVVDSDLWEVKEFPGTIDPADVWKEAY